MLLKRVEHLLQKICEFVQVNHNESVLSLNLKQGYEIGEAKARSAYERSDASCRLSTVDCRLTTFSRTERTSSKLTSQLTTRDFEPLTIRSVGQDFPNTLSPQLVFYW